jgi:hypothetical protein
MSRRNIVGATAGNTVLGLLALLMPGCGASSSPDSYAGSGLVSASQGGSVTSGDGRLKVAIPPDALAKDTVVSVDSLARSAWAGDERGLDPIGTVYRLRPEGLSFRRAVTLTRTFRPGDLAPDRRGGVLVASVVLRSADGHFSPLSGAKTALNTTSGEMTITGTTSHFSDAIAGADGIIITMTPAHVDAVVGENWVGAVKIANESRVKRCCVTSIETEATWVVGVVEKAGTTAPPVPGFVDVPGLEDSGTVYLYPKPKWACMFHGEGKYGLSMVIKEDVAAFQRSGGEPNLFRRLNHFASTDEHGVTTYAQYVNLYGDATCRKHVPTTVGNAAETTSSTSTSTPTTTRTRTTTLTGPAASGGGATGGGPSGGATQGGTSPGATTPGSSPTTQPPPPTPTTSQTTAPASYSVGLNAGCQHQGGQIAVDFQASTNPPQPGASYTAAISGPGIQGNPEETGSLDGRGAAQGYWSANASGGSYTITVTVNAQGATRQASKTIQAGSVPNSSCP